MIFFLFSFRFYFWFCFAFEWWLRMGLAKLLYSSTHPRYFYNLQQLQVLAIRKMRRKKNQNQNKIVEKKTNRDGNICVRWLPLQHLTHTEQRNHICFFFFLQYSQFPHLSLYLLHTLARLYIIFFFFFDFRKQ